MSKPDIWFADCEVYTEDLIWVFKNKRTKEYAVFHNDTLAVEAFFEENPDLWLCGFNFRDYDQYICKGTLLHFDNRQLSELNDILIYEELQDVWDYLGNDAWDVNVPPIIDLFHDIVPRKSLKEIEANIGMDVRETSVPFDIGRKLTEEELEECIAYCKHDVDATEALYYERLEYISTKKMLCELAGLSDAEMMKNTNARVVAEALHAEKIDPIEKFGIEWYADMIPEWIDLDRLPSVVIDFVSKVNTLSGIEEDCDPILFDLFGVPVKMGLGGIHASTGEIVAHTFKSGPRKGLTEYKYKAIPKLFETNDDRIVLIQDVGSFYPSMMILLDYLSRAIPEEFAHLYEEFYEMRMEAKAKAKECDKRKDRSGAARWKKVANAAKLVLNTVYGCMKNQYNKLYDPFMATCVCLSGQLIVMDLMCRIHDVIPDVEIVQLNTDGWVLSIPRSDYDTLMSVSDEWQKLTGFKVDTDIIKQMWQRDVNNYVIEFDTGKVKAKGGTVANFAGGNFKSNNATVIDLAIVNKLLYDKDVVDTVYEVDDLSRFQLVLKAGGTYSGCCKTNGNEIQSIPGKVHRVYAVKDGWTFGKVKCDGGNPAKFPDSPKNAIEDFEMKSIDELDRSWYINLAKAKLEAFIGEKEKAA